jgi:hypothetical protein
VYCQPHVDRIYSCCLKAELFVSLLGIVVFGQDFRTEI